MFEGDQAYIFQGADSRIAFAIPYERDFTLVGTTETGHDSMQDEPTMGAEEQGYLLEFINSYFREPVTPEHIVTTFSGVRPLLDEAGKTSSAVSREYVLDLDVARDRAPMLTVYGGKLTTYRTLAEKAVSKLQTAFARSRPAWTAGDHLPGGDIDAADFGRFESDMQRRHGWLDSVHLHRLLRAYGTRVEGLIGTANKTSDLGIDFGHGLTEAEVDYLCRQEFVTTVDDILWRRSKLGLRLDASQVDSLNRWMRGDSLGEIEEQECV